jgi:hypothetical protein
MAALSFQSPSRWPANSVLGPVGAIVGRLVGAVTSNMIDRALFGARNFSSDGPRLAYLTVMASTKGATISRVYGHAHFWPGDLGDQSG